MLSIAIAVPGIKVSIPESGITAFVILGSHDSIFKIKLKTLVISLVSLIDLFHVYILDPCRRYIRTVVSN